MAKGNFYVRCTKSLLLLEKTQRNGNTLWTDDANEAKRFNSQESAEKVAARNGAKVWIA